MVIFHSLPEGKRNWDFKRLRKVFPKTKKQIKLGFKMRYLGDNWIQNEIQQKKTMLSFPKRAISL